VIRASLKSLERLEGCPDHGVNGSSVRIRPSRQCEGFRRSVTCGSPLFIARHECLVPGAAFGPQQARSAVLNEVGLCGTLFLADQPDRAVGVGERALARARQLTSQRAFDRILNLRSDFARHLARPEVAQFARQIANLAPASA
jgi:hypothetical protein